MSSRFGRWALVVGAITSTATLPHMAAPAQAQGWGNDRACSRLGGRERARCESDQARWDRGRDRSRDRRERERERDRRNDAKTDGVVAGVVGTVLVGGIIAAIASSGKKKAENRDRRSYCEDRYGNYDERTDSYRASDGRWYRCQ